MTSTADLTTHIQDPLRLAALREVALLDSPEEEAFNRLTRLAARFTRAPVALVTLIDSDRQFFMSSLGLPTEFQELRETPLDLSFCQYNRFAGRPMVVEDSRSDPILRNNPATEMLPLIAYLGFPLVTSEGHVLGALCVIDTRPRQWTDEEIVVVEELAHAAMDEIRLRTERNKRDLAETRNRELGEPTEQSDKLHQDQKMEAIGRLAGGVAHDLNNLLTPILGYTESLLHEPQITPRQRRSLDEVFQASLRARDLVKKLLAVGRKQRLELRAVDLNTIVRGVKDLLRRTVPEDVRVNTELAPNLRPVLADAGEVERLVLNLAVNATDAMRDGGELSIATAMAGTENSGASSERGHAVLSVRDTGHGMDEETKQRAFDPFFSTKGNGGTGLGLATVFGVAEQHGGSVELESREGVGTTVRVYLPIARGEPVDPVRPTFRKADLRGTETIVLVEDNTQVRELVRGTLEQHGYHVLAHANGSSALEQLSAYRDAVHLLLTDVVMPGMNGRELFERCTELRPSLKALYMSGYAHHFVTTGVQLIEKPFSTEELLRRIRELL